MTEFNNASDFELRIFKKYASEIDLSIPLKRALLPIACLDKL